MKLKTSIVSLVLTAGLLAMATPANANTVATVEQDDVNTWMSDAGCTANFCAACAVAAVLACALTNSEPQNFSCQPAPGTSDPCICSFTCLAPGVDRIFLAPN